MRRRSLNNTLLAISGDLKKMDADGRVWTARRRLSVVPLSGHRIVGKSRLLKDFQR